MGWEKFYLVFFYLFLSRLFLYMILLGVSRLDIITLSTLFFFYTRLFRHQSPIYLSPCVIAYWLRKAFEWLSGCVWDKVGGTRGCL